MIGLGLDGYDPDSQHDAAVAFRIRVVAEEQYIPDIITVRGSSFWPSAARSPAKWKMPC